MPATEDAPSGHEVSVARAKDKGNLCGTCFYIARGSFPGVRQHDLKSAIQEHDAVREKPFGVLKLSMFSGCFHHTFPSCSDRRLLHG